ncbi:MAG: Glucosamine-fructose-6-phosphate aminotransferase (Isomerizing) [Candidatus Woesebacteria bacterium GW2011_GWB1_38_5]|uniref:Glutamine--fructose-6-phosphate aminotransferase [isomerizing] n=3 Tax=Candidatus Woeseibacteriota TaxID=1752722 RepID=A0A0G0MG38_9BACT|nr:MAG: Glucosamine-fructose-6-phosphate aminotransferase (Isomerizing) [Candidatus Woesebacteria bacterium GW2011_GWD1_38_10]KKQ72694.1 MAG: Glucosamine-fructose-6-phosphate aminotransferase (Isomerizing) [Candidatus Woesebacteria bacterium GW2011_GWB1_38_5]KKQ76151.1 MAG: Glucosamine-fructose-6-phosphate aminotransferase (Isomerizing) [Microgenomates group bacterium GW2011_GWF1_38_5]KKQ84756.1 MAG: Glucosamine-fructose-6-phosphate aminotransferase (Isomerizing) [Candidatus Woesebacteria bacter
MCGIFAYIGEGRDATKAVFNGLKRLDYRGYDSWGISIVEKGEIKTQKYIGEINRKLLTLGRSRSAIGHTRWATNGTVTQINAHPHTSSDKSYVLAHNGIVENFTKLKSFLSKKGYKFISDTDTEVILRLIEYEYRNEKDFIISVQNAFNKLDGRNTIIILKKEGEVIAVRNGSPLVVGISEKNNDVYFSSDTLSFSQYVDKTITLENGQMAICNDKLTIINTKDNNEVTVNYDVNTIKGQEYSKDGFRHFMIKEIHEEPQIIEKVMLQSKKNILKLANKIKNSTTVYCIGSGTAGAAAFQSAYYLRTFGGINAIALIGAEAKDYFHLFKKSDLIIALSQSGETADTLEVIEFAKKVGVCIASYVNMPGSLMTKISDYKFMANAGPEICVMSTKVFVSQIVWGYLLSKVVQGKFYDGLSNLRKTKTAVSKLLKDKILDKKLDKIATKLSYEKDLFLLAKGQNLQIIREGMIKLVEGGYIHAHAIPAGDLKHYAITLMEPGKYLISVISDDENKTDTMNAINEVKARGASVIGISVFPDKIYDEYIQVANLGETSAILNIIPLQLLAYKIAVLKGNNVDKPRNIAKSVTVK